MQAEEVEVLAVVVGGVEVLAQVLVEGLVAQVLVSAHA